jgi:transposase
MVLRKSEILWNNKGCDSHREVLQAECKRCADMGGTFEIEVTYTHTWVERYRFYYPEEKAND